MCYRETAHYVILCDRCGLGAPEGTGWATPSLADQAALEAGWEMTATEHLCPLCAIAMATGELDEAGGAVPDRPAMQPPADGPSRRPDVCWAPAATAAARSWEESR